MDTRVMTVTVTCIECGQPFTMDVDEEGWKVPAIQELAKTARCNKCFDLIESKKRSQYYAQKNQSPRDPF